MRLVLDHLTACHPFWSLVANGVFSPGVHLVSGDVGSGKSTLALMMAGLLTPESGTVIRESIPQMMLSFQFPEFHITGLSVAEECRSWNLDPDAVIRSAGIDVAKETPSLSLSRGSSSVCISPASLPGTTISCCSMSRSRRLTAREKSGYVKRSANDPVASP